MSGCQNGAKAQFIVPRIRTHGFPMGLHPSPHFIIYSSWANLVGFVFSRAVYCYLRRQPFKIIRAFKIVLGIVRIPKIRIPILLPNFPAQREAEWEESELVNYWEWLGWITTLEKFSKINSFSASQSLEDPKTCLSVPSFEQRSSKLPFWTFSSNLALKMLLKANCRTIYQLFKITQLSCHSTALK